MQKPILLILCIVLFFVPAIFSMGVSLVAIELIIIFLSLCFLLGRPIHTNRVVALMMVLVCIDKFNDLSSEFSISNIGPIIYTLAITHVFVNLGKHKEELITFMRRIAFLAVVINIFVCYMAGTPIRLLDRDVSVLLMFYFILSYYYGNKKTIWLLLLGVLFIEIFILEARTMILSFAGFLVLNWLMSRIRAKGFYKFVYFSSIVFTFGVIFYAIWYEFVGGSWQTTSELFTGRGYIWGNALQEIYLKGSTQTMLFGLPTTPAFLTKLFAGTFSGWLQETTEEILMAGHFHSTVVYYIFNTGTVGTLLFFYICYYALRKMKFSRENFCLFIAVYITSILNGRSLTGYYIMSTIFMLTLLVQLPPSPNFYNKKIKKKRLYGTSKNAIGAKSSL